MRKIRIYQVGNYGMHDVVELTEEAGQHVAVVLRMQVGQRLILFAGDGRECDADIIKVHKKKVTVNILAEREVACESPRIIHLAQAICKGERMEWVVQKAVELGVAQIHPILTQYGAYKLDVARLAKKQQQWQAIAIAACEQCGRTRIPNVSFPLPLEEFLKQEEIGQGYVLDPYSGKSWHEYTAPLGPMTLLIGPEGGLSPKELDCLLAAGFLPIKLGPRILRTETAAISALSVVQLLWGDL